MTEYVVFVTGETVEEGDEVGTSFNGGWSKVGTIEARSAEHAIRRYVEDPPKGGVFHGGTFAAVPARSWKPVKVSVETKTSLKFS